MRMNAVLEHIESASSLKESGTASLITKWYSHSVRLLRMLCRCYAVTGVQSAGSAVALISVVLC